MSNLAETAPLRARPNCFVSSSALSMAVVVGVSFAILFPSLTWPLGPDGSAYAYVARRLLQGDVLYRDVWESKLGIYFLYASVFRFFGDTALALRGFDMAWQLVTAGFVALMTMDVFAVDAPRARDSKAMLAGVLYTLFYMDTNFWSMGQADSFLNLPTLIAVYGWRQCARRREWSWAVWAGFGLGVAMLLRPTAAVVVLLLPLVWRMLAIETAPLAAGRRQDPSDGSDCARAFLVTLLAAAMVFAPFAVYFTVHHAWSDFGLTWFVMNPFYASQIAFDSTSELLVSLGRQLQNTQWLETRLELVVIVFGPLFALTQLRANRRLWLPLGYLLVVFLGIAVQGKFFVYQWSPLYPPLAILGASLLDLGPRLSAIPPSRRRRAHLFRGLATAFLVVSCLWVQGRNYVEALVRPSTRYFVGEGFSYSIQARVASYIRARTSPFDRICVWGFSPAIYFLSRREAATGRMFLSHLLSWPATPRAWRQEFIVNLRATRPRFIVVRSNDVMPQLTGRRDDSRAQMRSFPVIREFVERNYKQVTTIGDPSTPEFYEIYRRVEPR